MPRTREKVAAIVLDGRDYGESDQIVTFFCQELGRMSGIAKGAKRSQKRFVNKLELFSSLSLHYSVSRQGNLAFIAEAELVDSFLNLRKNPHLFLIASVMRELIMAATRDLEGDDGIFALFEWGLQSLQARQPALTILSFFQIRFLEKIGYRPHLHSCCQCKQPFRETIRYSFDNRHGGLVCEQCQDQEMTPLAKPLSPGTIKILEAAQNCPLHRLHRLHLSGFSVGESLSFLHRYQQHLLQRDICSLKLLGEASWQI
jgi:DNA repair protein RecO (recombination protein O)